MFGDKPEYWKPILLFVYIELTEHWNKILLTCHFKKKVAVKLLSIDQKLYLLKNYKCQGETMVALLWVNCQKSFRFEQ